MKILHLKFNGAKYFEIDFYLNRFKSPVFLWLSPRTNGARKGIDNCFDFNMEILGLHISYTDYDYWRFKNNKEGNRNG